MYQIQISAEQMTLIRKTVKAHLGCKLLVFGLGNDSVFWQSINQDGVTVFLEDDARWFYTVMGRHPYLSAFLVSYGTQLTQWKTLLEDPRSLQMTFPRTVEQSEWDVILVDAPAGRGEQFPGRMKSIFAAARLVSRGTDQGGDVFVHDCEREVEREYCNHYLKSEHLQVELAYTWLDFPGFGRFIKRSKP
jgi:glucuronoxylan 4-O-methyltransferase